MICYEKRDDKYFTGDLPPYLLSVVKSVSTNDSNTNPILPDVLDGSCGTNRAPGPVANHASNDLEAIGGWLRHFSARTTTLSCYRREAERLFAWAIINCAKPLSSLTSFDMNCYRSFLTNPSPKAFWVAKNGLRTGRTQDDWRPFSGPLSESSTRQAFSILNRMFSWFVDTRYLLTNPLLEDFPGAPQTSTLALTLIHKNLDDAVIDTIDSVPCLTQKEKQHVERERWIFCLLYFGGLSISEIAEGTMGIFKVVRHDESAEWWIDFEGVGGRQNNRRVSRDLMSALIRYRLVRGLSAFPTINETTPLVLPLCGRNRALGTRALYGVTKALLTSTSLSLQGTMKPNDFGLDPFWIAGACPSHLRRYSP